MRHTFSLTVLILTCVITGVATGQERDQPREAQTTDRDIRFQPQNDRERALWNMIQQLRSEVTQLRQQIGNRDRPGVTSDKSSRNTTDRVRREGDMPRERDSVSQPRASNDPLLRQATRIFAAYDKNRDQRVSFDEWLAMREGEMTSDRRAREMGFFSQQAGDDRMITLEEFHRGMVARQRGSAPREGGKRDGEARSGEKRDQVSRESVKRDSGASESANRNRDDE
jgi:hypothetical protein